MADRDAKFGNIAFFAKPVTLKTPPPPPTVFVANDLNFAQTLTTKLQRSSRSRIFKFASQNFFRKTKSQNFIEKSFMIFNEGLFFASAVLTIPRSRYPELRYRLEIQNGKSY